MTSEPYCPEPFDATEYENRPLDETAEQSPRDADTREGTDGTAVSSSAPAIPGRAASASSPSGALPPLQICPNCLTEVDEDYFCSGCGRLTIDRAVQQTIAGALHGPEGDPC